MSSSDCTLDSVPIATALLTDRFVVSLVIRFALPVRVTESAFRVFSKSPALAEVPRAMELLPLALASSPMAITPFLSSCSSVPVTSGFVLVAFSKVNALASRPMDSEPAPSAWALLPMAVVLTSLAVAALPIATDDGPLPMLSFPTETEEPPLALAELPTATPLLDGMVGIRGSLLSAVPDSALLPIATPSFAYPLAPAPSAILLFPIAFAWCPIEMLCSPDETDFKPTAIVCLFFDSA